MSKFLEKHPDCKDEYNKDGTLRFHCTKYTQLDEDGNPIEEWEEVNGVMKDVTEIHKLEREIKQIKKELER